VFNDPSSGAHGEGRQVHPTLHGVDDVLVFPARDAEVRAYGTRV